MILHTRIRHQFVHYIPERLEPGVVYVSIDFATAVHSCCCGCGHEIVTPIAPRGWKLIFDGETISLSPSIGNQNLPCRSHYFIERNRVIEPKPWMDTWDAKNSKNTGMDLSGAEERTDAPEQASTPGMWWRVKDWISKRNRQARP